MTLLGKILGGGLPVGAFGGKAEIMDQLAPEGPVYQAGNLSGNPLNLDKGRGSANSSGEVQTVMFRIHGFTESDL